MSRPAVMLAIALMATLLVGAYVIDRIRLPALREERRREAQRKMDALASANAAANSARLQEAPSAPPRGPIARDIRLPARVRSSEGYPAKKGDTCTVHASLIHREQPDNAAANVSSVAIACGTARFDATIPGDKPITQTFSHEYPGAALGIFRYDLTVEAAITKDQESIGVDSWAMRAFVRGSDKLLLLDVDPLSDALKEPALVAYNATRTPHVQAAQWSGRIKESSSSLFKKGERCEARLYPELTLFDCRFTVACESGALLEASETRATCKPGDGGKTTVRGKTVVFEAAVGEVVITRGTARTVVTITS